MRIKKGHNYGTGITVDTGSTTGGRGMGRVLFL